MTPFDFYFLVGFLLNIGHEISKNEKEVDDTGLFAFVFMECLGLGIIMGFIWPIWLGTWMREVQRK